jgi:hypothetical protein
VLRFGPIVIRQLVALVVDGTRLACCVKETERIAIVFLPDPLLVFLVFAVVFGLIPIGMMRGHIFWVPELRLVLPKIHQRVLVAGFVYLAVVADHLQHGPVPSPSAGRRRETFPSIPSGDHDDRSHDSTQD